MSAARPTPPRDRRFAVWIATTALLFLAAVAVGFVWLPVAQAGRNMPDLWSAICSAVGLSGPDAAAPYANRGQPASEVAWTPATERLLSGANAGRGAALAAASCNGCHGRAGLSDDAIFPNLAGQGATSIYKQWSSYPYGDRLFIYNAAVRRLYRITDQRAATRYFAQHKPLACPGHVARGVEI